MAASSSLDPWENLDDQWTEPRREVDLEREDTSFDYENVTPEMAGQRLADYIIYLKSNHTLTAVQTCILSYWAHRAGSCGLVSKLAFAPNKHSSHYSRHYDFVVGFDRSKYYDLDLPQSLRMSATRALEPVSTLPVQDAFQKLVANYRDARESLNEGLLAGHVPPSYNQHPVTLAASADEIVLPLVLYVDGVNITRRDGCVGYTLYTCLPPRPCFS